MTILRKLILPDPTQSDPENQNVQPEYVDCFTLHTFFLLLNELMYGGLDAKKGERREGHSFIGYRLRFMAYGTGVESNHGPCMECYFVHTMILLWLVSAMEFNV